ncbi:hypothetical protein N8903_01540 [Pelagibacterales bacterium]|nr:hypothetical protein [Pelagibacterales bacterium]
MTKIITKNDPQGTAKFTITLDDKTITVLSDCEALTWEDSHSNSDWANLCKWIDRTNRTKVKEVSQ